MRNKKFTELSTSEDEDEILPPRSRRRSVALDSSDGKEEVKKRKRLKLAEEEEDEEEGDGGRDSKKNKKEVDSGGEEVEDAKPIGESVRSSGKGRGRRKHYVAFEFDGNQFELEDPVLLVPEDQDQKPYVAIIKDIAQLHNGNIMVTGQWFYRPEEAERKGGGSWQSRDTRELFYSFHRDEVPAESVMHKCVVHFVPIHKQLPSRKQHPGFIVQKVYDTVERKLWRLTDKDYEDNKQHEIDILVQKTLARLGDLPDIGSEDGVLPAIEEEDQSKNKRALRRKGITPLDVTRDDDTTIRNEQNAIAETPGSYTSNSEYNAILLKFKVLTGENHRDKWLERLLQGLRYMCSSPDGMQPDNDGKVAPNDTEAGKEDKPANDSQEKTSATDGKSFLWPDAAIPAVVTLEKAAHDALYSDFQKYNQKLRQLVFNLKNNQLLARRLLKKELEPSKILNMTPQELKSLVRHRNVDKGHVGFKMPSDKKEGLTEEETAKKEPDESERMQMTDARCRRCNEFKVAVRDIIQAGHGDRYQLECIACGNAWYASRDEVSMLTIEVLSSAKTVGEAPIATTKFEKQDEAGKSSEAYMPVLETQKSIGKLKNDAKPETPK